jgi:hypothetical protein
MVDASNADFLNNPDHLKAITDALEQDYNIGQHPILLP